MKQTAVRFFGALLAAALVFPAIPARAAEGVSVHMSDYTGKETVIAVIDAGFDVTHKAFSLAPAAPSLDENDVEKRLGEARAEAYVSQKIPFAYDYAEGDFGVGNLSSAGTAAASAAAGAYLGKGDVQQEDGKVVRDADFFGAAPDAQLLLMKAAKDNDAEMTSENVAAAIRDAISLGADVILLNLARAQTDGEAEEALRLAARADVPVFAGTGDLSSLKRSLNERMPAAMFDRGMMPAGATAPSLVLVGALSDPYAHINHFLAGDVPVYYADSSLTYLGRSFGAFFAGQTVPLVAVSGVGTASDYEGLDAAGKLVLVSRGEISFPEKAAIAAAHGAVGMIVADNGGGLSQMALTDSPIPAVMIREADGDLLRGADAPHVLTFDAAKAGVAPFSGSGVTAELTKTVSFSTVGQNVLAASADGYAYHSGTQYAAAVAAGYLCRAAEYLLACGADADLKTAVLAAAAVPVTDADGERLSPRLVGAGALSADGTFPTAVVTDENGNAVSALQKESGGSAALTLQITNLSGEAKRYMLSAAFSVDEVDADGFLTGGSVPVTGIRCTTGLLAQNIGQTGTAVHVGAYRTVKMKFRLSVPLGITDRLRESMPYGHFMDGVFTLSDGEDAVLFPITAFWGTSEPLPLSDASVFDGGAMIKGATLGVRYRDAAGDYTIGIVDRTAQPIRYDAAYALIHPVYLRGGALFATLTPLCDIDSVTARVLDADGHVLSETVSDGAEKYTKTFTEMIVPIWDFTAADNAEYVFPDGEYTAELILHAGEREQTITFPVHADSKAPTVSGITVTNTEDGRILLAAEAADETALGSVSVYDTKTSYLFDFAVGRTRSFEADISAYNGGAPLYVEITDYAGGYTVVRLTKDDITAMLLAAQP